MIRPAPFALLILALIAVASPCRAQGDALVPRPEIRAGDLWRYRLVDYDSGKVLRDVEQRVSFANDRVIQLVQKDAEGKETDVTATAEWNQVSSANGGIFYPHNGVLRFPLRVGDSWHSSYEVKFPQRGAYDVKHDREVRVVGWEDVEVPAGKFRALKVVSKGSFQRLDMSLAGSATETLWYAPQVKRFVKWSYETRSFRGRIAWRGIELLGYELQ